MPTNRVITGAILHKFSTLCNCENCHFTDSFIVSTYLRQNQIVVRNNSFLLEHLIDDERIDIFIEFLDDKGIKLSLEDLVVLFEFVVSPQDKEINGAVYTPDHIREYIVTSILERLNGNLADKKYVDIACGCGGFLVTLAKHLHNNGLAYADIFRSCLYGVDIEEYSINRTKIMLSLLAIESEDVLCYEFSLIHANSLCFDWSFVDAIREHGGFDVVVGNPPYVGSSKIDRDTLELVKQWEVSSTGKADMYIPFFQIGVESLVDGGVLGYITVNNFYRSVNGRALRNFFAKHNYDLTIIDFGAEQIFQGRSTYTCLCFLEKVHHGKVHYTATNSDVLRTLSNDSFVDIDYRSLLHDAGWVLASRKDLERIRLIRSIGMPLGDFTTIRNGFATLKNDVYLFTPDKEDSLYYYISTENGEESIEKAICRDAIKGNILRKSDDIRQYKEKVIFPYNRRGQKNTISPLSEIEFINNYPHAYQYLLKRKSILERRSNSQKITPWFSYGRRQALDIAGDKLLFPYIADNRYFIFCEDQSLLFYNGYCIADRSRRKILLLKKILNSKLFWYYITKTSKPYGGAFFALAKNYVKSFGVISLTDDQIDRLINMTQSEADLYIEDLYGIHLN